MKRNMEDWHSVAQQAFLLTIIHFGPTSCQIPEEKLKINVNDNFSLKACTWSGDCCRGIRLGRQWNQLKQVLLSTKPLLLLPPACVHPPTPPNVLALFILCPISQWCFWNLSPVARVSLLVCSLHQSCSGWALPLWAQLWLTKRKSSSHLCTFGKVTSSWQLLLLPPPPLSPLVWPIYLLLWLKQDPPPSSRPSPSPSRHPCRWLCPLPSLEALFICVSPCLFVSHSAAWFIVGDSHA